MTKQNRAKWQSKIVPNGKVESCQMANLDLLTQSLLIDLQHIKIFLKKRNLSYDYFMKKASNKAPRGGAFLLTPYGGEAEHAGC